jgi:plastocyanin
MRRHLVIPLLAVAFVLAACGDTSDAGSEDERDTTSTEPGTADHGDDATSTTRDAARRIEVTGASFSFDPPEIRAAVGEDVTIVLTSEDMFHDLTVDELEVHVSAAKGETAEGGLRADAPGSYTYYCSVGGHRSAGMEGTLVIE